MLRFTTIGPNCECETCQYETCQYDYGMSSLELSEQPTEPFCSSEPCECCGDSQQGNRYDLHGLDDSYNLIHTVVCEDCADLIE